jgi:hypothetical protein
MRWVAEYERAWRSADADAVTHLFTEDVHYLLSPYAEPSIGHAEIQAFWRDDEDRAFTVASEAIAVDAHDAVIRLEVRYLEPRPQEYRDLWILRFADDGRVERFEEWAFWPDKPYTAA